MAINNTAQILFDETDIESNTVSTTIDQLLTITKTVDQSHAIPNGILLYSITINNPNDYDITNGVVFTDAYDDTQVTYVDGSFTFQGGSVIPTTTNPITYTISDIPASESVIITFQVTINAN